MAQAATAHGVRSLQQVEDMKLTIVPFESVAGDLPRDVARQLRSILPWRFKVSSPLPDPIPQDSGHALDVNQLWSLLSVIDRHDELTIGLTALDLAAPDLEYVFGYAAPERRAAAVSVFRLACGTERRRGGRRLFIERVTKEMLHEAGHLMGLPHCDHHGCLMQYSQTLHDTDIKQCRFCPDCLRELSRLPEPTGER